MVTRFVLAAAKEASRSRVRKQFAIFLVRTTKQEARILPSSGEEGLSKAKRFLSGNARPETSFRVERKSRALSSRSNGINKKQPAGRFSRWLSGHRICCTQAVER